MLCLFVVLGAAQLFGAPTASLTYDRAGNLKSDGGYSYQYEAWNRLVQV